MSSVPPEILNKIYILLKRQDIKEASAVCKNWNKIAAYFLGNSICVSLYDFQYHLLQNDICDHPSFAAKIDAITIKSDDTIAELNALQYILNHCPNLKVLKFTQTKIYSYLNMINSKETHLQSIQTITINNLMMTAPSIKRLYIWINLKYKTNISSLQFTDVEDNRALKKYGGLVSYTSRFRNLTCLKIHGENRNKSCINLTKLLKANRFIEDLTLKNVEVTNSTTQGTPYPSLKRFYLRDFEAGVSFLGYIVARFENLENLYFTGGTINQCWIKDFDAAMNIIDIFNSMSRIKTFNYAYEFNGRLYTNSRQAGIRANDLFDTIILNIVW